MKGLKKNFQLQRHLFLTARHHTATLHMFCPAPAFWRRAYFVFSAQVDKEEHNIKTHQRLVLLIVVIKINQHNQVGTKRTSLVVEMCHALLKNHSGLHYYAQKAAQALPSQKTFILLMISEMLPVPKTFLGFLKSTWCWCYQFSLVFLKASEVMSRFFQLEIYGY